MRSIHIFTKPSQHRDSPRRRQAQRGSNPRLQFWRLPCCLYTMDLVVPLGHYVIPSVLGAMTSFFSICASEPPYGVAPIAVEQGSASASPDRSTIVAHSGEAVNPLTGFILATVHAEQLKIRRQSLPERPLQQRRVRI